MIGIGAPQYRWRLISQSRSRYRTVGWPQPWALTQALISAIAGALATRPSNRPELTSVPSPVQASFSSRLGFPEGLTTSRIGRADFLANAKSRSSPDGTAMIAPVPYDIST